MWRVSLVNSPLYAAVASTSVASAGEVASARPCRRPIASARRQQLARTPPRLASRPIHQLPSRATNLTPYAPLDNTAGPFDDNMRRRRANKDCDASREQVLVICCSIGVLNAVHSSITVTLITKKTKIVYGRSEIGI